MSAQHWADEAILGQRTGPPSIWRRLYWKLKRLCSSGLRLCLIVVSTTALVVLGISCLSPQALSQAEQVRQDINKDAKRMMKREIIPASKEAVNELKRLSEELFPDKIKEAEDSESKQHL